MLALATGISIAQDGDGSAMERRQQQDFIRQADELLFVIANDIVRDDEEQFEELDSEEEAIRQAFHGLVGRAATPQNVEEERQRLKASIKELRTFDFYSTRLMMKAAELNELRARATVIALVNGLDVERLDDLYRAGLGVIRGGDFERSDRTLPSKDERLSAYFRKLFDYAMAGELEAEMLARRIDYKKGLYFRMAFAYLDALLASGDRVPPCDAAGRRQSTDKVGDRVVPVLGCPDPVVDRLRAYVDAIREIQSADADRFLAQAEEVVAEQQLSVDFLSAAPLVGEALDLHALVAGENLAGQCLSPAEKGLTAIFVAVPVFGPQLVKFALRRSESAVFAMFKARAFLDSAANIGGRLAQNLDEIGTQGGAVFQGMANFFGMPQPEFQAMRRILDTEFEITGLPSLQADEFFTAQDLARLRTLETTYETLQDAKAGRVRVSQLSGEIRERAVREASERMARNVSNGAVIIDSEEALKRSNMVEAHVNAFADVARNRDEVIIFRAVNPDATRLIEAHFATKGMSIKGKSADWGPQAGLIPVDQKFSKLGNPDKGLSPRAIEELADPDIARFHSKVAECLEAGVCEKMNGVTTDGKEILVRFDEAAGREVPVLFDGQRYFHYEKNQPLRPLDLDSRQIGEMRPLEVLAVTNAEGRKVPLTADYDFLAIGDKGEITKPDWHPTQGAVTPKMQDTLEDINEAARTRATHPDGSPYQGGNVVHHGPEAWYPDSPGALANDPEITILDPAAGPIVIPRCDRACMQNWCSSTGECAGLSVCAAQPVAPCIPVDPDRILKDYFHSKRLDNYNLSPNAAWEWGDYNGIGGWTVDAFLRAETFQRWTYGGAGLAPLTRNALWAGKLVRKTAGGVLEYAFTCSKDGSQ